MFAFKELQEKFLNIPEDVREAISSNEVNEKLLVLAEKYSLQYDEAEELTKEIGYIMLGLKPKDNFVKNIQKVTELDFEKSKALAEEINSSIFESIRDSLRQIHEGPTEEIDEDLDENLVREELLNELSKPKETGTDLMKYPTKEIIDPQTDIIKFEGNQQSIKETPLKESEIPTLTLNKDFTKDSSEQKNKIVLPTKEQEGKQSTDSKEQEKPKSYTIDPYREPIE
ncbi:hypothetical protein KJ603_02320 [Patescibacteria group bacterium]|nr:hypothetical protein [Patescibacteria group bacterium]